MHQRFKWLLTVLYVLSLSTILIQFVYMAQTLTGLNHEGSIWFHSILNQHTYVTKEHGWRWSDILWQLPTVFSVRFLTWVPYKVNLFLLSYSYILHPIMANIICYWLVRKEKDAAFYMTFPLLSLGTAVACNIAFAVGVANGAITFFWPLFFIFCFKDISKTKYAVPALILLLALSLNYEPALAFLPILAWVVLKNSSFKPRKSDAPFLILLAISFVFQIIRINVEYFNQTPWIKVFWHAALNENTSLYHFYLMGITAILFFGLFVYAKTEKKFILFAGGVICLLIVAIWSRSSELASLVESRENRASAIPIAAAIAVSMAYIRYFRSSAQTEKLFQYVLGVSCISFFASSIYLSKNISAWSTYVNNIHKVIDNEIGCIYIENNAISNSIAFTSILIQLNEEPSTILLTHDENCSKDHAETINPCDRYVTENIDDSFQSNCGSLYITSGFIDLSKTKLRSQIKKIEGNFSY